MLTLFFGATQTLISFMNYKQVSYVARVAMMLTVFVFVYCFLEAGVKIIILENESKKSNMVEWASLLTVGPLMPGFLNMLSQATGMFEGIPLLPSLYSNARNQKNVSRVVALNLVVVFIASITFSPLGILAYGSRLQEVILFNVEFAPTQHIIKGIFASCMLFSAGMNTLPIIDIFYNFRHRAMQIKSWSAEDEEEEPSLLSRSFNQFIRLFTFSSSLMRFMIIFPLVYLGISLNEIELAMMLNGSLCANFFQILLPNYMLLKVLEEQEIREKVDTVTIPYQQNPIVEETYDKVLAKICMVVGFFDMVWGTTEVAIKSIYS